MSSISVEETLDWEVFVSRYWDRAPVLFRSPGPVPFVAEEVFEAATATVGPDGAASKAVQLTSEGRRLPTIDRATPHVDDGDFDSYVSRITERLGGDRHALVISSFHAYGPAMWSRQRAFFAPLWQRVGIPMTTALTTLFHGNYEHSPVGVHKDRYGTFMYVLSGRKRMRMWSRRPWEHDASTIVDYDQYLDSSISAEAEAGQLLYWPSSHFHVGENIGDQPATSVNVGVPREERRMDQETVALLGDTPAAEYGDVGAYLASVLPPVEAAMFTDGIAAQPPDALRLGLDQVVSRLTVAWTGRRRRELALNRYTAGGFQPVPAARPLHRLSTRDRLRLDPAASILWCVVDETSALCSANGHTATETLSPRAMGTLFDGLDRAQPPTVTELCRAVDPGERDKTASLLAELCTFRALDVSR